MGRRAAQPLLALFACERTAFGTNKSAESGHLLRGAASEIASRPLVARNTWLFPSFAFSKPMPCCKGARLDASEDWYADRQHHQTNRTGRTGRRGCRRGHFCRREAGIGDQRRRSSRHRARLIRGRHRAGCGRSKPVQQRILCARLRLPGGTGAGLLPGGTVLPAAQLLGSILPALLLVLSR